MKPAIQTCKLDNTRSVAQVCSEKCASYLESDEPMPIEVHLPKTESKLFLSICSNGATFQMGKGKVSVHVLRSDKPNVYQILYQIRHAYLQKIIVLYSSADFQSIKVDDETLDKEKICEEIEKSKLLDILKDMQKKVADQNSHHEIVEEESESHSSKPANDSETPEPDENFCFNLLDL